MGLIQGLQHLTKPSWKGVVKVLTFTILIFYVQTRNMLLLSSGLSQKNITATANINAVDTTGFLMKQLLLLVVITNYLVKCVSEFAMHNLKNTVAI